MRVVIVVPLDPAAMPIGGIASFVRGFIKFAPPDFELALVGTSATGPVGVWQRAIVEGREIDSLAVARDHRRGAIPLSARYTAGLVRWRHAMRGRGDGVLQFHRPATALPLLRAPQPKVRVVHLTIGDLASGGGESRWRRFGLGLRAAEGAALRRMDRVYVVNEVAAAAYRAAFPTIAERIRFVPNWVDDEIFGAPDDATRDEVRAAVRGELGWPVDVRIALSAGRLEGQKDPLLLVRALAAAMASEPTLRAIVAGDGRLRQEAAAEATRLAIADRTRFIGSVARPELARLMVASDVFVIASAFETGPTVGLEALATGLAVATTDVGTVGRVTAANGSGAVAAARTPTTLADSIRLTLAREVTEVRRAALLAAAPYRSGRVLEVLYDDHRRLARGDASAPGP